MNNPPHKKIIPYHLILSLQKNSESLESLEEYFQSLLAYFSSSENPGIQKNVGSYYSNQAILVDLYHEYQEISMKLQQNLRDLKNAESIKSE